MVAVSPEQPSHGSAPRPCALPAGVHRVLAALYDAVVDAVFHVRAVVRVVGKESGIVRFILGEEQRHLAFAGEDEFTQQRSVAATALVPTAASICLRFGFPGALLDSAIHDAQSFRNQSVGSRCSSAASGPRWPP